MPKTAKITNLIYLGPEGSYTEIAAEELLRTLDQNITINEIMKTQIVQVIESVDNNNGDIGVVPIENSIEGIVRETLDTLSRTTTRVMITGEVIIPIAHCLISKGKDIKKIDKVISKPEALGQCQYYISSNLNDNVEKLSATSTSEAVKCLKDLPENYAAIGTFKAAKIYGMNVLSTNINDEKDNLTRFVSLGSKIPPRTGCDKTSIAFSSHNQPGSLVDILNVFKQNDINLSYIESRPSKKVFGDYTFFIDFEGHIEDEHVQKAIGKIAPLVNFYRFLGSYPKNTNIVKI